eukprot:scaffold94629_cov20-Tisochrysis_lutea.AAC.2
MGDAHRGYLLFANKLATEEGAMHITDSSGAQHRILFEYTRWKPELTGLPCQSSGCAITSGFASGVLVQCAQRSAVRCLPGHLFLRVHASEPSSIFFLSMSMRFQFNSIKGSMRPLLAC